jgi:hypothetical protein
MVKRIANAIEFVVPLPDDECAVLFGLPQMLGAVDLRLPAPASGERRDPPEAATPGSFRMPLADGHSRDRRCVACWHLRV